jgi:signal transduction histidine kinase
MARFRRGDSVARAGDARLSEVSELAATFNEMADAIVQTRRDQVTFLAAVAHDLRSPLQALKMGVHVLARETKPIAPQRCARLERQIDRLTRMVGDLLDATRIEAGELALHLTEFDLRTAAQAMIDLFTPTATEHGITLKAPDRAVLIRGDSLRIEQVISNLLSNAIKYSPAGGPVEVAVSQTDREAELSVSDRGWGIPAEEIANMFLPFRRLPATSQIRGVGLGLSVVARIVSAHGGRIEVESTPGVGSTFRVRLPLAAV